MNYHLTYLYFLSMLHFVYSTTYIRTNNVEITYSVKSRKRCISNNTRFRILSGISLANCIIECGSRQRCAGLNYKRYIHVCELFSSADSDKEEGNCIFVLAASIAILQSPCGECNTGMVCDMYNGACSYKECYQISPATNGYWMGNINSIDGRKKFTCDHNNVIKYSTCLENGHWSETVNCNEDKCSPNPCENGGTCDNQEDGYYCTCTDGYEGLMCADVTVADHCYVNTIWNYSGKKNVTRSGLPCDRWDEHIGEWNIDPQYIHESSLTEAENNCRNPTPTLSWGLWCVLPGYLQWAFCDIPQC